MNIKLFTHLTYITNKGQLLLHQVQIVIAYPMPAKKLWIWLFCI